MIGISWNSLDISIRCHGFVWAQEIPKSHAKSVVRNMFHIVSSTWEFKSVSLLTKQIHVVPSFGNGQFIPSIHGGLTDGASGIFFFFNQRPDALTGHTDWSRSSSPSDTIFNSLDGREPCCNVLGMGWFMWDWWGGNSHWTLFFVEDGIWGVLHFFSILNQLVDSSYTYEILLAYHQFHQKLDILNSHEILWAYHIYYHSTGFCMLAKCSTDRRSTIRGFSSGTGVS